VGEHHVAQVGLAAARKTVNVNTPAKTKKTLKRSRAENQQWVSNERFVTALGAQRRIDAAFDQPRQGDAGEIGGDQRNNTEEEQPAIAVNQEFDAVIIVKNFSIL
jgi:hypothetical protein